MTVKVIIEDRFIKYHSSHDYFVSNAHLGYVVISQSAFFQLPEEVHQSLEEAKPEPFIQITAPGLA
jgi:hypothetical protein